MVYNAPDPQTVGLVLVLWIISIVIGRGVRPLDLYALLIVYVLLYGVQGIGYGVGGIVGMSFFVVLWRWVQTLQQPPGHAGPEGES